MAGLNLVRGWKLVDDPVVVVERHNGWTNGWVARITLAEPQSKYDLEREFLSPARSQLSRAGNGTKTYDLREFEDGWYEAESVARSYQSFRVYFEVRDHGVQRVVETKQEVKKILQEDN